MKRFFCFLWFLGITLVASGYLSVWAEEIDSIPDRAEVTLSEFTHYLNSGDLGIYGVIDPNNLELRGQIAKFLNGVYISYEIGSYERVGSNVYRVNTRLGASGVGWNVSGMSVYFDIGYTNDEYKIINTNLFDYVGADKVFETTEGIFKYLFRVAGIVVGSFILIGIIVALFFIIRKKKRS